MNRRSIMVLFLAAILLTGCGEQAKLKAASEAVTREDYETAEVLLRELDGYKDSGVWLRFVEHKLDVLHDQEPPVIEADVEQLEIRQNDKLNVNSYVKKHVISVTDDISENLTYEIVSEEIDTSIAGADQQIAIRAVDEAGNEGQLFIPVIVLEPSPVYLAFQEALHIEKKDPNTLYHALANAKREQVWMNDEPVPYGELFYQISQLSSVDGDCDFARGRISFSIADLSETASEMELSEEMFGYDLATLSAYTPEMDFFGPRLSFDLKLERRGQLEFEDLNYYNGVDYGNPVKDGEHFFYFPAEGREDYATKRGIRPGCSQEAVLFSYGKGKAESFEKLRDSGLAEFWSELPEEEQASLSGIRECLSYSIDTHQIIFCFDSQKKVDLIVYVTDIEDPKE